MRPMARQNIIRNIITVAAVMIALSATFGVTPALANSRYAAYVFDLNSDRVLFSRYARFHRYPASLTKMMTLYLVFEELSKGKLTLKTPVPISRRAARQPRIRLGLKQGSSIKLETAIKALIVRSANDVAVAVAELIGRTESQFAKRMTRRARQLGMRATTFRNASGLPNRQQKTTARDIAILATRLILDFPDYYHYFSTQKFTYKKKTYRNHNRLLGKVKGIDGLKTGYINASGYNLAVSQHKQSKHLIAVVMGGRTGASRNAHMKTLLANAAKQSVTNKIKANINPPPPLPPRRRINVMPRRHSNRIANQTATPSSQQTNIVKSVIHIPGKGVLYRLGQNQEQNQIDRLITQNLCAASDPQHVSCLLLEAAPKAQQ